MRRLFSLVVIAVFVAVSGAFAAPAGSGKANPKGFDAKYKDFGRPMTVEEIAAAGNLRPMTWADYKVECPMGEGNMAIHNRHRKAEAWVLQNLAEQMSNKDIVLVENETCTIRYFQRCGNQVVMENPPSLPAQSVAICLIDGVGEDRGLYKLTTQDGKSREYIFQLLLEVRPCKPAPPPVPEPLPCPPTDDGWPWWWWLLPLLALLLGLLIGSLLRRKPTKDEEEKLKPPKPAPGPASIPIPVPVAPVVPTVIPPTPATTATVTPAPVPVPVALPASWGQPGPGEVKISFGSQDFERIEGTWGGENFILLRRKN
ncbi:MAG: hypothetical protein AAB490_01210 [Patescibacteria group bacterium]